MSVVAILNLGDRSYLLPDYTDATMVARALLGCKVVASAGFSTEMLSVGPVVQATVQLIPSSMLTEKPPC